VARNVEHRTRRVEFLAAVVGDVEELPAEGVEMHPARSVRVCGRELGGTPFYSAVMRA
jgi:hypothetical protein